MFTIIGGKVKVVGVTGNPEKEEKYKGFTGVLKRQFDARQGGWIVQLET